MADPKNACNWQCWRGHKRAKEESVTLESNVQTSGVLQKKWSRKQGSERQILRDWLGSSDIKDIVHSLHETKQEVSKY